MTPRPTPSRLRTADTMQATADGLEEAEAKLHRSAEASPDDDTARRLHELGDQVTAEAMGIAERADRLAAPRPSPDADADADPA